MLWDWLSVTFEEVIQSVAYHLRIRAELLVIGAVVSYLSMDRLFRFSFLFCSKKIFVFLFFFFLFFLSLFFLLLVLLPFLFFVQFYIRV